jgi:hypothetical protein
MFQLSPFACGLFQRRKKTTMNSITTTAKVNNTVLAANKANARKYRQEQLDRDIATARKAGIEYTPGMERFLIDQAAALIHIHAGLPTTHPALEETSISFHEDVSISVLTDLGSSEEACATFGMTLFGEDLVPDFDPASSGGHAQAAFMIGSVYMQAVKTKNYAIMNAMTSLAVAAHAQMNGAPTD